MWDIEVKNFNDLKNKLGIPANSNHILISKPDELLNLIKLAGICESITWFRGQASDFGGNEDMPIGPEPGIFRKDSNDPKKYLYPNEDSINLLFRARAGTRHAHQIDREDLVGWLFLAQHFGAPTRILDWSESLLAGLFMAAGGFRDDGKDHDLKNGILYVLDPCCLNDEMLQSRWHFLNNHADKNSYFSKYLKQSNYLSDLYKCTKNRIVFHDHPEVMHLASVAFNPHSSFHGIRPYPNSPVMEHNECFAVMSEAISMRQVVQQGVFTIHGGEGLLKKLYEPQKYLFAIQIHSELKKGIRKMLKTMGICKATLFPDLDHLSEDVSPTPPING